MSEDDVCFPNEALQAERNHYRAALEVIASPNRATYDGPMDAWKIATEALTGERP